MSWAFLAFCIWNPGLCAVVRTAQAKGLGFATKRECLLWVISGGLAAPSLRTLWPSKLTQIDPRPFRLLPLPDSCASAEASAHFAVQRPRAAHVRFGSKSVIA